MRTLLLVIPVAFIATTVLAEPELKGSPSELAGYLTSIPRTVTVTGDSELKVSADRANISLKAVTESRSLEEALRVNRQIRARVATALAEQGIPAERIQSSKFSSTPKYGLFAEKAKSYRVENLVKVEAQNEKEFQAVAGLVDAVAEIRYQSIEFEHSNKDALKTQALAQALDKADERKRLYEQKLGIKLTARRFAESSVSAQPFPPRRYYSESKSDYGSLSAPSAMRSGEIGESDALAASFGELIYSAQVSVDYIVQAE